MSKETMNWGMNNDYARLTDVLLGTPEYFRWVDAGPLTARTLNNAHKTGVRFDLQTAMAQHTEMVSIYAENNVNCHYLEADPVLHRNFFARDSSAMTPWGALICHMQLKVRRADYVTAIQFYQNNDIPIWQFATAAQFVREQGWQAVTAPISREFVHMDGLVVPLDHKLLVACVDALEPWVVQQLKDWGFSFVDVPYREAKDLGVNLVALGNSKVLSMQGATELNANLRAMGYEVYDPDMSMFTLGGGGVHCLCQALCREEVASQD